MRDKEEVDTREVYFLIARFLEESPCRASAELLKKELNEKDLLPLRVHGYSSKNVKNRTRGDVYASQTYEEAKIKYPHVGGSHLADCLSRLLQIRSYGAPSLTSLLGSGRLSVLGITSKPPSIDSRLKFPNRKAGMVMGLHLREIYGGLKAGQNRSPSIRAASYSMVGPSPFVGRIQPPKTLRGHRNAVYCAVFDGTGRYLITGSDDRLVKIWCMATGLCLRSCRGHIGDITDLSVSRDDSLVASASNDHTIRVWSLPGGAPISSLIGHCKPVTAVVFSPAEGSEHILLSSSEDGTCRLWDARNGQLAPAVYRPRITEPMAAGSAVEPSVIFPPLAPLAPLSPILCCAFNAEGTIFASGGEDMLVRVWNPLRWQDDATGRLRFEDHVLKEHNNDVNFIQFSGCSPLARRSTAPDRYKRAADPFLQDLLVTCSRDGSAIIWKYRPRQQKGRAPSWIPVFRMMSDSSQRIHWSKPVGSVPARAVGLVINMVMWSLDNKFVIGALSDCRICVWNASTGHLQHSLPGHEKQAFVVDIHPTDARLVMSAGYDGKVIFWDIWEGVAVRSVDVSSFEIVDGHFSPDGTSLAVSDEVGQVFYLSMEFLHGWKYSQLDQFFLGDYSPVIEDPHGGLLDQETQLPPHERNLRDLLCDAMMLPYPDPIQCTYQTKRYEVLKLDPNQLATEAPAINEYAASLALINQLDPPVIAPTVGPLTRLANGPLAAEPGPDRNASSSPELSGSHRSEEQRVVEEDADVNYSMDGSESGEGSEEEDEELSEEEVKVKRYRTRSRVKRKSDSSDGSSEEPSSDEEFEERRARRLKRRKVVLASEDEEDEDVSDSRLARRARVRARIQRRNHSSANGQQTSSSHTLEPAAAGSRRPQRQAAKAAMEWLHQKNMEDQDSIRDELAEQSGVQMRRRGSAGVQDAESEQESSSEEAMDTSLSSSEEKAEGTETSSHGDSKEEVLVKWRQRRVAVIDSTSDSDSDSSAKHEDEEAEGEAAEQQEDAEMEAVAEDSVEFNAVESSENGKNEQESQGSSSEEEEASSEEKEVPSEVQESLSEEQESSAEEQETPSVQETPLKVQETPPEVQETSDDLASSEESHDSEEMQRRKQSPAPNSGRVLRNRPQPQVETRRGTRSCTRVPTRRTVALTMAAEQSLRRSSRGRSDVPPAAEAAATVQPAVAMDGALEPPRERERKKRGQLSAIRSPKSYAWLMNQSDEGGIRFVPQLGDDVVYFRQGHDDFLRQDGLPENMTTSAPWLTLEGSIRAVEFCRVVQLEYVVVEEVEQKTACKLQLLFTDEASEVQGKTFTLTLLEMDGFSDFLILRGRYEATMAVKWSVRDSCKVWWSRGSEGGQWWSGKVKKISDRSPLFPGSPWERILVTYGGNWEPTNHSPWELLLDPADQWLPPRIDKSTVKNLLTTIEKVENAKGSAANRLSWFRKLDERARYLRRVACPIALSTIKERLSGGYFRSVESLVHNISLIKDNARLYFGGDSIEFKHAQSLVDLLIEACEGEE